MGTLYVVATPIGNLEDVTLRALRVLGEADLVCAEDTRRTRTLLSRFNLEARLLSLHAHNEASKVAKVLEVLEGEGRVALVSDAGMPLLCDPGQRLVAAAIEAGFVVETVPGPSAILAALSISGLKTQPFTFVGYLPRREAARRTLIEAHRDRPETLVCFESPRRVAGALADLRDVLGARRACVARELTKLHEETARGDLAELAARFEGDQKGEFTLVIEGASRGEGTLDWPEVEALIRDLLAAGDRPREIAAELAATTGQPKRALYARAVALQAAL
ncbi:MAG: 16S rRNA (cytidine(1402)-2'-O)-methyltransferase [Myxococcota bacterium]|jgi:16S rRNA (cytidine1402-2'-O)-methyltransferase